MSYKTAVAWKVKYGDPVLDAAVVKVAFNQYFDGRFSYAVHTFGTKAQKNGQVFLDAILGYMEGRKELSFQFVDLSDEKKSIRHRHLVAGYAVTVTMGTGGQNRFTVTTVEKRIRMDFEPRNEAHKVEGLDEIVRKMAGRNGLEPWAEGIEEAPAPDEFKRLVQPGITDHEFLICQLVPRSWNGSRGGFRAFTRDGAQLGYSTPFYNAGAPVKPFFEEVMEVTESAAAVTPIQSFGSSLRLDSFDPLALKSLKAEVEDFPRQFAGGQPLQQGKRSLWMPCRSQEACDVWAKALHDTHCWGYAFSVKIRGTDRIGEEQSEIRPNMVVSLSGTKYRANDGQRGFVTGVLHEFSAQTYNLTLHCARNGTDV